MLEEGGSRKENRMEGRREIGDTSAGMKAMMKDRVKIGG